MHFTLNLICPQIDIRKSVVKLIYQKTEREVRLYRRPIDATHLSKVYAHKNCEDVHVYVFLVIIPMLYLIKEIELVYRKLCNLIGCFLLCARVLPPA